MDITASTEDLNLPAYTPADPTAIDEAPTGIEPEDDGDDIPGTEDPEC